MGAQVALRGFWLQAACAVLEGARTFGRWASLTIEPHPSDVDGSEKVDIRWQMNDGSEHHVQVKSAKNPVGKSALDSWSMELSDGSSAARKSLHIIGVPATTIADGTLNGVEVRLISSLQDTPTLIAAACYWLSLVIEELSLGAKAPDQVVVTRFIDALFAGSVVSRVWSAADFISQVATICRQQESEKRSLPALPVRWRRQVLFCPAETSGAIDEYALFHIANPGREPIDVSGTRIDWTITDAKKCELLHVTDGLPDLPESPLLAGQDAHEGSFRCAVELRGEVAPGQVRTAGFHVRVHGSICRCGESWVLREPFFETDTALPTTVHLILPEGASIGASGSARVSSRTAEWGFDTSTGQQEVAAIWAPASPPTDETEQLDERIARAHLAGAAINLGCQVPDWLTDGVDLDQDPEDPSSLWRLRRRLSGS